MGGRTIHVFNITISLSDVFHQRPRPRHLQERTSYHLLSSSPYIPTSPRRHSINSNITMNINITHILPTLAVVAGAPWTFHRLVTILRSTLLNHTYSKIFCRRRRRRLKLGLMNSQACIQCMARLQIQTLDRRCITVFIHLHNRHLRQLLIWILLIWD